MPLYDFKCQCCGYFTEKITCCETREIPCVYCRVGPALRQLSAPGGFRIEGAQGKMFLSQAQKRMIKEPVWEDPRDGSIVSAH